MKPDTKNNHEAKESAETGRRSMLGSAAFLGGCAAISAGVVGVFSRLARAQHLAALDSGKYDYPHNDPENAIYSACLQCHTACPIKCKVVDGVLVKIDGNPYSAQTNIPNVPYANSVAEGAKKEGKICPKGQAGIETLYDPHRIRKVLKRKPGTPRGGDQWVTIDFRKAVKEIVEGGNLFGEGKVEGLKDICALRDRAKAKALACDAAKVASKEMTLADFKKKHAQDLDKLIDPDHPDLGPKNNQFVFLAGRIEHGRKELMKWFTGSCFGSINSFEHTTICEQSHHIAFEQITNQWQGGKWTKGKDHMKPDLTASRFVIFFGTGFADANFGPPLLSGLVSNGKIDNGLKLAVVDPRLSRSAGKADWWIPIKPGEDAAFAMGMARWILDNRRYDRTYLENATVAAAGADKETTWTTASYLVKIEDGQAAQYLRADEVKLGTKTQFVVSRGGKLAAVDPYDSKNAVEGDLDASYEKDGVIAKAAFALLKARVAEMTLAQYAARAGVEERVVVKMAREFTSHGKQAMAEFYRGAIQHTNGYYNAQAIITLNLLIGNADWKGGMAVGGGHWHESGGKPGTPYDFKKMHPSPFPIFGVRSNREKAEYEASTLFKGYPAKRPWYPFTENLYQEVIPSAGDGYPYPIKALILHKGTPVLSCPTGHKLTKILQDTKKIPLFIACDIVVGETSMYADYIFPDTAVWERWGTPHATPAVLVAISKVRQPAVAPLTGTAKVDGVEMPVNLEAFLIESAKQLALPGFGKDALGAGADFHHQDDWYMKFVANIAMGDKEGDSVPAADAEEMALFAKARSHLPKSVFDLDRMKTSAGEKHWPHVVYVLNRGGRFEDSHKMHKGDKQAHTFKGLFQLYVEKVAKGRNSISGKHFDGLPRVDPPTYADGEPINKDNAYPFQLITYKEIFGGHSRTMPPDEWLGELMWENGVVMNRKDADRLGLAEGDKVRLSSPSNTTGTVDLGNGEVQQLVARVIVIEGMKPGVVGVSAHFGHWAYGSRNITVDGKVVQGDASRARGISPNALMLEDKVARTVCLTDPIGGSASFYDTCVQVKKV